MKTVPLRGKKAAGRVALVDDQDYDVVMQYRWHVWESARDGRRNGPCAIANVKRDGRYTTTRMHNLIMGSVGIDHKDHDGLNNQRHNLRSATQPQNTWNQRPVVGSSSQYKGVSWYKAGHKWGASIGIGGGRKRTLGRFASEVTAALAYDAAARELFGEFAYLNFPDVILPPAPPRICQECPAQIPDSLRAGTKFCSAACRDALAYQRLKRKRHERSAAVKASRRAA